MSSNIAKSKGCGTGMPMAVYFQGGKLRILDVEELERDLDVLVIHSGVTQS